MPKVIPPCPQVPENRRPHHETREYQIQLVTPLFGGGVEAGQPDASLPIRGAAIRGQLQFWWRATRGTSCSTRDELFARHKEIWGTTDKASPVVVEVVSQPQSHSKPCARYDARNDGKLQLRWNAPFDGKNSALSYVLFPFQGQLTKDRQQVEAAPADFIEQAEFRLRI